jgi:hypothetical protein
MSYDRKINAPDAETYPYSEAIDDSGYHYKISVVYEGADGQLQVLNERIHIELESGEWVEFLVPPPKRLFPGQKTLSEKDLLRVLSFLASESVKTKRHTAEDIQEAYLRFKEQQSKVEPGNASH